MGIWKIIKDKCVVNFINDKNFNKKGNLVYFINNKLNIKRNKGKKNYFKDLKPEKLNYRPNQKTLYTVSDIKYYNFF